MKISVCIIARNQEEVIGGLVAQLARQTSLMSRCQCQFVFIALGCSDNTAATARGTFETSFTGRNVAWVVHEIPPGAKTRAWNLAVHELIDAENDFAIFLDAAIELIDNIVLDDLIGHLAADDNLVAISGHASQDVEISARETLFDRLSRSVSQRTSFPSAICGELYAVRLAELHKIWLPVPIPREEGILAIMLQTDGFSRLPKPDVIARSTHPTHYMPGHSAAGVLQRQTRMIVSTVIHGWVCDYLWSGVHTEHVGRIIRDRNLDEPQWIGRLIESRVGRRRWVLPPHGPRWHLDSVRGAGLAKRVARVPATMALTLFNFWISVRANRKLKQPNAADDW